MQGGRGEDWTRMCREGGVRIGLGCREGGVRIGLGCREGG